MKAPLLLFWGIVLGLNSTLTVMPAAGFCLFHRSDEELVEGVQWEEASMMEEGVGRSSLLVTTLARG